MSELRPYPAPTYRQRLKTAFHYLLPQLAITRTAGWLAERRWGVLTHAVIKTFAACYQINMAEAQKSRAADYASFNEFFIRPLKDGARPINAEPQTLVLPSDGRVSEAGVIEAGRLIQAKGHDFTALELLAGDEALAAEFSDGLFLTTYLSPRDYHRVHMPCDAALRRMIYVPGELYSVNPFLAQHIPNLFARNERLICVFDTEFGTMVQILVGATVTASISTVWAGIINPPRSKSVLQWLYPAEGEGAVRLAKGQEMGAFRLGSTVINLFPQNSIRLNGSLAAGAPVRMGEALGVRADAG